MAARIQVAAREHTQTRPMQHVLGSRTSVCLWQWYARYYVYGTSKYRSRRSEELSVGAVDVVEIGHTT